MACGLSGATSLRYPMLIYCEIDCEPQTSLITTINWQTYAVIFQPFHCGPKEPLSKLDVDHLTHATIERLVITLASIVEANLLKGRNLEQGPIALSGFWTELKIDGISVSLYCHFLHRIWNTKRWWKWPEQNIDLLYLGFMTFNLILGRHSVISYSGPLPK